MTPPRVTIDPPLPTELSERASLIVRGRLSELGCTVEVNGRHAGVRDMGFTGVVPLAEGDNHVRVVARDVAGNLGTAQGTVSLPSFPRRRLDERLPRGLSRDLRPGVFVWSCPDETAIRMVQVPAGEFIMGSSSHEGREDERPPRLVDLSAYYLGLHEVTNAQFAAFVDATGYVTDAEFDNRARALERRDLELSPEDRLRDRTSPGGRVLDPSGEWRDVDAACWTDPLGDGRGIDGLESHPVVQVSWNDAREFCEWARLRLPTEAEWEKAARFDPAPDPRLGRGRSRVYPWGDEDPLDGGLARANLEGTRDDARGLAPVGSWLAGASPCGALDMVGNALEWCQDFYGGEAYGNPRLARRDPVATDDSGYRVARGGSFADPPERARTASRWQFVPTARSSVRGFRVALSLRNAARSRE